MALLFKMMNFVLKPELSRRISLSIPVKELNKEGGWNAAGGCDSRCVDLDVLSVCSCTGFGCVFKNPAGRVTCSREPNRISQTKSQQTTVAGRSSKPVPATRLVMPGKPV